MGHNDGLIPMQPGTLETLKAGTPLFIAVDINDPTIHNGVRQIVGTFVRWDRNAHGVDILIIRVAADAADIWIREDELIRGYWAPMGYRPPPELR